MGITILPTEPNEKIVILIKIWKFSQLTDIKEWTPINGEAIPKPCREWPN